MIQKISYVIGNQFNPYRNLALEEYLLDTVKKGSCILYLWQNEHTVVIGKNQNAWKECKVQELEQDGGYLVRRLSGGGAVFHDLGNLNFTFLLHKEDYNVEKQLDVILNALVQLGIKAEKSGRNDITVDGKKFSGNAFYTKGDHCYHHGTILVNVNMGNLSRYLNVSKDKLVSKGVESVKSRVTNLITYREDLTTQLMKEKLIEAFSIVYGLEPDQLEASEFPTDELEKLYNKFSSWDWKFGRKLEFQYSMSKRFPWGDIEIHLEVNGGIIKDCMAYSDAMEVSLVEQLPSCLEGCTFSYEKMAEAMEQLRTNHKEVEFMIDDIKSLLAE